MNSTLRYLVLALLAVVEAFALTIAAPMIVLALVAFVLLVWARGVAYSVRVVSPHTYAIEASSYDVHRVDRG